MYSVHTRHQFQLPSVLLHHLYSVLYVRSVCVLHLGTLAMVFIGQLQWWRYVSKLYTALRGVSKVDIHTCISQVLYFIASCNCRGRSRACLTTPGDNHGLVTRHTYACLPSILRWQNYFVRGQSRSSITPYLHHHYLSTSIAANTMIWIPCPVIKVVYYPCFHMTQMFKLCSNKYTLTNWIWGNRPCNVMSVFESSDRTMDGNRLPTGGWHVAVNCTYRPLSLFCPSHPSYLLILLSISTTLLVLRPRIQQVAHIFFYRL